MKNPSANLRNFALLKVWLGETLSSLKKNHVRTEYGEIINASEISNGDETIDDVWNLYNHQKFPDKTR